MDIQISHFVFLATCAAFGFCFYDQVLKPLISFSAKRISRKVKTFKENRQRKKFDKGVCWAWGVWGSKELSYNVISFCFTFDKNSPYASGVEHALKEIFPFEEQRRAQELSTEHPNSEQ